jgi:hypothetical protein
MRIERSRSLVDVSTSQVFHHAFPMALGRNNAAITEEEI